MIGIKNSRRQGPWSLADTYDFISTFLSRSEVRRSYLAGKPIIYQRRAYRSTSVTGNVNTARALRAYKSPTASHTYLRRHGDQKRQFHDYFVTHLPSSSLHPDSRSSTGPHHKLPRAASIPHTPGSGPSPAAAPPSFGASRELTVVRIPLRSAKHHFGVSLSRGQRPYNEDTYQAGTIEIPAFAKRAPISLSRGGSKMMPGQATSADNASRDPQVFYFGVFDGHGGNECSDFLKEELHSYIENTVGKFELGSSLRKEKGSEGVKGGELASAGRESLDNVKAKGEDEVQDATKVLEKKEDSRIEEPENAAALDSDELVSEEANKLKVVDMEKSLIAEWKDTVGGYFRRFRPEYFALPNSMDGSAPKDNPVSIETVLMYAFLKADLDFVTAQAAKPDASDSAAADRPLNDGDILGQPAYRMTPTNHRIGGPKRFAGGSTASVALISTPTPTPFWHPASPSTLVVAHVGDTRILLCETATGIAKPITTNHHPSSPVESTRLRRYAATFVTDSFGEERMSGLANTRAFGDMRSKRIGVSAEPEIVRVQLAPAEYSFIVLVTDGVSGSVSDQEIVDVVKEAKTPEQGARDVVSYATEVTKDGDNATCLVVRLGGWERRNEGGMGSMGTKEVRDFRRGEALDPRRGRT